jgi:hypothetical protein
MGEYLVNKILGQIRAGLSAIPQKAKMRIGIGFAAIVILQLYFVRELIAAELLFVLVFAFLFAVGGVSYLAGAAGERVWVLIESGVRASAPSARRAYSLVEEFSRKPFRHPRSESAQ